MGSYIYILKKRRIKTNNKFGFVKYDCPIAAEMAILKADKLCVDNRSIRVKFVEFSQEEMYGKCRMKENDLRNGKNVGLQPKVPTTWVGKSDKVGVIQPFAHVVKGGRMEDTLREVNVKPEGNEWLGRSLVAKIKIHHERKGLIKELESQANGKIRIRRGGGQSIVLTFLSQKDRSVWV